ncbi:MAG: hypothetical protein CMN30_18675 [Sandaracinus sp.]|nr:hypothetical protein [Sandaracinus sp.]
MRALRPLTLVCLLGGACSAEDAGHYAILQAPPITVPRAPVVEPTPEPEPEPEPPQPKPAEPARPPSSTRTGCEISPPPGWNRERPSEASAARRRRRSGGDPPRTIQVFR